MRVSGFDSIMSAEVKEGVELPKFIRTLIVETAEEEQQLRLFLTGALKVDEHGCHALGHNFGSNALAINPDVSNGKYALATNPSGSDESRAICNEASKVKLSELLTNCTLDTKIEVINALSAVVNMDGHFDAKYAAAEKLSLLIQEL